MPDNAQTIFYERHMPHYQPHDAMYAVMFRLAGSLPIEVIRRLKAERDEYRRFVSGMLDGKRRNDLLREHAVQHFEKFHALLDAEMTGPHWLKQPQVAEIVSAAIHHWDARAYELLAYCIMPNHVHLIFSIGAASTIPLPEFPLKGQTPFAVTNIVASIKKHSASKANKVLQRSGAFWQDETFDHVIRDGEELEKAIWYVLYNPVKAGFVKNWEEWRWSYVKPGLIDV